MFANSLQTLNRTLRASPVLKISARSSAYQKVKRICSEFFTAGELSPPYSHICQIGDPVLRERALAVEYESIKMEEFGQIINRLFNVMRYYKAYSLSLPQIGLPWQVFVVELTQKTFNTIDPADKEKYKMEVVPAQVFINPKLKVIDNTQITLREGCGSIRGHDACVPRAREIEVTALNILGYPFTYNAKNFTARLIQHECDHLKGKLFTDVMVPDTFQCVLWKKINIARGRVKLPYYPRRGH